MVTKSFTVKVSKIKNNKDKNYYVHRINIPSDVIEDLKLNLDQDEYLFLQAKKAEWYHLLDWSTMNTTWDKLPNKVKNEIISDGLMDASTHNNNEIKARKNIEKSWAGTGYLSNKEEEYCIGSG